MPHAPTSRYWLSTTVFRPYAPAICHVALDDPPTEPEGDGDAQEIEVGLNIDNTQAVHLAGAISVQLINTDHPASLSSSALGPGKLSQQQRDTVTLDPFFLPLTVDDNEAVTQAIWRDNTELVFSVSHVAHARAVLLRLVRETGDPVDFALIPQTLALMNPQPAAEGVTTYRIALSDALFSDGGALAGCLAALNWQTSPFRLSLRVEDQERRSSVAWTYLHVPSAADVDRLEQLADLRIALLTDSFGPLGANNAGPGDLAARDALLSPTPAELEEFNGSINEVTRVRGILNRDQTIQDCQNTIAATEQNIAQLEAAIDAETTGINADLHQTREFATTEEMTAFMEDIEGRREANYIRNNNIRGNQSTINFEKGKLQREIAARAEDPQIAIDAENRARLEELAVNITPWSSHTNNALFAREGGGLLSTAWAIIAVVKRANDGQFRPWKLFCAGNEHFFDRLEATYHETIAARHFWSSQNDIDHQQTLFTRRPRTDDPAFNKGGTNWFSFDVTADAMDLAALMTYGVSSCCAGITFPDVDDPDLIILSHINNNTPQPIDTVLGLVRAEFPAGNYNAFCSMLTVFPQPDELLKFTPDEIFPAAVRPASRVLMLPRSRHIYDLDAAAYQPHSRIGLTFSDDRTRAQFVAEYGYESAAAFQQGMSLLQYAPTECGCAAHQGLRLDADFQRDVFGLVNPLKQQVQTPQHVIDLHAGLNAPVLPAPTGQMLQTGMQDLPVRFTSANIGSALFDTMNAAATPACDTDCLLVGEKARQVLNAH